MRIFLGSSNERIGDVELVAQWVREAGHEPWPWTMPGLFPVGEYTFNSLNLLKDQVEGSIFIFGEDDKIWYRQDTKLIPRDNVLIEYGLFAGVLEPSRVAICISGDVKMATDLFGITHINLQKTVRAQEELGFWLKRIANTSATLGRTRLIAFQNKFSMPATHRYWRDLAELAQDRFVLIGGSNKSWIQHSADRRNSLGLAISRILTNGGHVSILCRDEPEVVERHARFVRECVISRVQALPKASRAIAIRRILEGLTISTKTNLNYQAVISDDRIVVMPLLNSPEFKEESLAIELSPVKHGEHYTTYQNDILRTVEEFAVPDFVKLLCRP